ncbi:MAG TPA: hypothetical protein VFR55_03215 [Dehalococcoidia bacterium]|nr:hypothetical protein [Dehalococcoidia bacterium]
MPSRTEDRQTVLEKAGIFESYYALSQFPGGWTGERVGIEPGEIADLVEAGLVRRVRDDHGWLVEVSLGREIERACGARALWLLGPATARAGMWDLVAEQQPDVLLLDEFEKINGSPATY